MAVAGERQRRRRRPRRLRGAQAVAHRGQFRRPVRGERLDPVDHADDAAAEVFAARSRDRPALRRGIEGRAAEHPLLAVEQVIDHHRTTGSRQRERRARAVGADIHRLGCEREAVGPVLELGAVLMKAAIGLDALVGRLHKRVADRQEGLARQQHIAGDRSAEDRGVGPIHPVRAGVRAGVGASRDVCPRHDRGAARNLGCGELRLYQEDRLTEQLRRTDLVVPPVGALGIQRHEGVVGFHDAREKRSRSIERVRGVRICFGHTQQPREMGLLRPAGLARVGIVDIAPAAVGAERRDVAVDRRAAGSG